MIVVDTSALVAILLEEPEANLCEDALSNAHGLLISAGTLTEAYVVAARRRFSEDMADLIVRLKFQVVPVDVDTAEAAGQLMHGTAEGCTRPPSILATASPMCWPRNAVYRSCS